MTFRTFRSGALPWWKVHKRHSGFVTQYYVEDAIVHPTGGEILVDPEAQMSRTGEWSSSGNNDKFYNSPEELTQGNTDGEVDLNNH